MPLGDEGRGRHHLARRAVPALERVMLEEGPLHRMQLPVGSQSLDRGYLGVRDRHGQRHAGQYPPPSYVHRAGAALTTVATHFRAGQPQPVTQGIQQRDPRFQHHDVRAAVDPQRNFALLVEPHAANVSASMSSCPDQCALRRDLRRVGEQGDDQPDHRQGAREDDRLVQPGPSTAFTRPSWWTR